MKTEKDIGELYKDKFANFAPQAPEKIWNNISNHYARTSVFKTKYIMGVSGMVALVAFAIVWLQTPNNETKTNSDSQVILNKPNSSIITSTETSIVSEKQTDVVLFQSTNTPKQQIHNTQANTQIVDDVQTEKGVPFLIVPKDTLALSAPLTIQSAENNDESTDFLLIEQQDDNCQKHIIFSKDTTIMEGEAIYLFVQNANNLLWSNGEKTSSIFVSPMYDETFSATFSDENGKDTSIYIQVKVEKQVHIFIPSAFTPNGDGLNDDFRITASEHLNSFHIAIASAQNKQILFQSNNIDISWDGTFKNVPQPHGRYLYTINYTDKLGKTTQKQGEFLLIREY